MSGNAIAGALAPVLFLCQLRFLRGLASSLHFGVGGRQSNRLGFFDRSHAWNRQQSRFRARVDLAREGARVDAWPC